MRVQHPFPFSLALPQSARPLFGLCAVVCMGFFSNRIKKERLKPGDHIYTWRIGMFYSHHGIYVGDDTVIHFTAASKGGGSFSLSSSTANGVRSSSLSCFLDGGDLYRFHYAVSWAFLHSRVRGGTCSRATPDRDAEVVRRANSLLIDGFGSYNVLINNCETFATYCKTGSRHTSGQILGTAVMSPAIGMVLIALPVFVVKEIAVPIFKELSE